MLMIAEKILELEKADGFITGDSLGQVASQTLENVHCIYSATKKPILTPLLGFDKVEIMKIAREIGTYETSILPYEDCCSFLVAKHPATKARLEIIKSIEEKANLQPLIEKAIMNVIVQEVAAEAPALIHNAARPQDSA